MLAFDGCSFPSLQLDVFLVVDRLVLHKLFELVHNFLEETEPFDDDDGPDVGQCESHLEGFVKLQHCNGQEVYVGKVLVLVV